MALTVMLVILLSSYVASSEIPEESKTPYFIFVAIISALVLIFGILLK